MEKVETHPQKNHILALASAVVSCIIRADIDSQNNDGRQRKILVLPPSAAGRRAGFALAPGFLALTPSFGSIPGADGPLREPAPQRRKFLCPGQDEVCFCRLKNMTAINRAGCPFLNMHGAQRPPPAGRLAALSRHSSYDRPALPRYCGAGRKSKREDSWKSTVLRNHLPFWSRS